MADATPTNFLKRDFIVREPLLVFILVLITVAFSALTHAYSQAYDQRRTSLGTEWFEHGKQELRNNRYLPAVEDFRTALLYNPQNAEYRMRLADALMQAGQTEQALNYYQGLWQSQPNNGNVNLQLARLNERKGDANAAERYFNGAIFGDWPENAAENRRTASLELIHFYLGRGDMGHAESQLIILSENLPEDPKLHTQVADLFARVDDSQRALNQYRQAERLDPNYPPAIQGAGEAAFRMGDFHTAQAYLTHSVRLNESNVSAKKLLTIIQLIFLLDPYERGLPEAEKIKRTLRTFEIVGSRLQSCSASSDSSVSSSIEPRYERWKQLKAVANARFLTQHPEEIETLLEFSTSSENLAQSKCGEPSTDDSAILAIAQHRDLEDR
jgi:tetratricopeptide (TPR) repeat protein